MFFKSEEEVTCVALTISVGKFCLGTWLPKGILKLSSILNDSKTASIEFPSGLQDAVNAAARTNLEGGVKSPGNHINPDPPPIGFNVYDSNVTALLGTLDKFK